MGWDDHRNRQEQPGAAWEQQEEAATRATPEGRAEEACIRCQKFLNALASVCVCERRNNISALAFKVADRYWDQAIYLLKFIKSQTMLLEVIKTDINRCKITISGRRTVGFKILVGIFEVQKVYVWTKYQNSCEWQLMRSEHSWLENMETSHSSNLKNHYLFLNNACFAFQYLTLVAEDFLWSVLRMFGTLVQFQ